MRLRIAALAREHVFVHAGAVAVDGRALLLPGETFCGKSTLVAALVAEGATYYSDEYAVLDDTGAVHPYARRLSIRDDDGGSGWGNRRSVEDLGGIAGTAPARPAIIAITVYAPGERWEPQPRNAGIGALALLANAFLPNERPEKSMRAVTRAAGNAQVLEGKRGEAGRGGRIADALTRRSQRSVNLICRWRCCVGERAAPLGGSLRAGTCERRTPREAQHGRASRSWSRAA